MDRLRFALLGVALAALCIIVIGIGAHASNERAGICPRGCGVVLIVVDTLAASHIGTYGYERDTMPRTEAFFETRGVVFERAYAAAPWTFPSFSALYFSELASRLTYADVTRHSNRPSLQSALRDNGVAVRGFLLDAPVFIIDAVNFPFLYGERVYGTHELHAEANEHMKERELTRMQFEGLGDFITSEAESDRRYFTMLHTFLVHDPYAPQSPHDRTFGDAATSAPITMDDLLRVNRDIREGIASHEELRDLYTLRYDQEIVEMDEILGSFLHGLSEDTLADTVIIVTSDHGEAFKEHDYFWHAQSLYNEEIRVPLFMYVPGARPRRVYENVSLLDVAPTILSLAGVPTPNTFTGNDLRPLLEGRSLGDRAIRFENGFPSFLQADAIRPGVLPPASLREAGKIGSQERLITQDERGVMIGSLKLMRNGGTLELYDLENDPAESHNLFGTSLDPEMSTAFIPLGRAFKAMLR